MKTNSNDNSNIEMEARVKIKIYKTLLEEERHKNKRNAGIGISLFIVGIVTTTTLYNVKNDMQPSQKINSQVVQNITSHKKVPRYLEKQNTAEVDFINSNVVTDTDISNVKEEDFFVSDFKM